MKNIAIAIVAAMLFASTAATAGDDHRILVEFGFGFGHSSGAVTDKNPDSKWCKHRNRGRMKMGAIRYQHNDVEVHFARWTGDHGNAVVCDRDMNAFGVGYVLSTYDDGELGREDEYATWTPGLAYTWGRDRVFTGKDSDNTNWRQTGNFQVFNRVALGATGTNSYAEVAVHRYGTFNRDHGENFVTVGIGWLDLDDNRLTNGSGDREILPPGDVTIINEGDEVTNNEIDITIIDNTGLTDLGPGAQAR